jgi:hypothetical protein
LPVTAASWLLTRGWAGSLRNGLVVPGTSEKSTKKVSQPALFDEKSGGDAFGCATAPEASVTQATPARRLLATHFAVEANVDIFCPFLICPLLGIAHSARETGSRVQALLCIVFAAAGYSRPIYFTAFRFARHAVCGGGPGRIGALGLLRRRAAFNHARAGRQIGRCTRQYVVTAALQSGGSSILSAVSRKYKAS